MIAGKHRPGIVEFGMRISRALRSAGVACLIALSMLFAVSLAMRSGQSQVNPSHASLNVPTNVVDFGCTSVRQQWRVPFQICNSGNKRLIINQANASCGCGDSLHQTLIIPPGESVNVTLKLDTRFGTGLVETTSNFTTSDPEHPRFNLTARAFVDDDRVTVSEVEPRKLFSVLVHD